MRRPRAPGVCVGIDLAGVEHRESGVAVLHAGRLELLTSIATDDEVVSFAKLAGRWGTVAINAPLTRPLGRCCLDDDCRCRHDPGTRSRQLERELARMGIPALATALIKVLARRGGRIAARLREVGYKPLEVYPFATLRLLGLPWRGKKTTAGRRRIHRALKPLVPGLNHPKASEHQLDAVVCALTGQLWRQRRTRTVGLPEEGLMIIPDVEVVQDGRDWFRHPKLSEAAIDRRDLLRPHRLGVEPPTTGREGPTCRIEGGDPVAAGPTATTRRDKAAFREPSRIRSGRLTSVNPGGPFREPVDSRSLGPHQQIGCGSTSAATA